MNLKGLFKTAASTILLKIYFPRIHFKIIDKQSDLKKIYRLCWQIYGVERKYFDPSQSSPDLFDDDYEKYSIIIGAYDKEEIIGTVRMIFSSPLGFYATEDFNIDLPQSFNSLSVVEIDRFVVPENYRIKSLISFGMLKKAFEISKIKKIDYWLLVIPEGLKNYFSRSFGVKLDPLRTKPLTEKQAKIRNKLANYYTTGNPSPYIVPLKDVL